MIANLLLLFSLLPQSSLIPEASYEPPRPTPALERALEAIDAERVRADLSFIASDELQGRDTPSQGLRLAARYIRSRLQRAGLQPGGDAGSYFHEYQLTRSQLDEERSFAEVEIGDEVTRLTFGEDYYFMPGGVDDLDLDGPIVFAGRATRAELDHVRLDGSWALVFQDDEVSREERRENVVRRGALGLIVVSAPEEDGDPLGDQAPRVARWVARGSLRVVTEEPTVPHVYLANSAVEGFGVDLSSPRAVGASIGANFRDARAIAEGVEPMTLENVAGLWPGADLRDEVIVISAHYDHVGENKGEIYNGADDNGSGTCGLLSLADALVAHGPMRRSVLLLWVSGEEKGLLGSQAWTTDPTLPEGMRAVANLNIDMIGRNAPDSLLITPTREHTAFDFLTEVAEGCAPLEGFPELGSADAYWRRSDHANFSENLGIPVAFLFSDVHEDYHRPTDTVEKIDYDKIVRVTRLLMRMLGALQGDDLRP